MQLVKNCYDPKVCRSALCVCVCVCVCVCLKRVLRVKRDTDKTDNHSLLFLEGIVLSAYPCRHNCLIH